MAKGINMAMIGTWAFLLGLVVAVVLGLIPTILGKTATVLLLGLLGIIVGLLNIGDKEVELYLIANIAFLAASAGLGAVLAQIPTVSTILVSIVNNIMLFVAPGAAVVALRALYDISRE